MPRKLRMCMPEVTYHTISRCIEAKPLMRSSTMKNIMLEVLNQSLEKYSFQIIAYTIMDNHFHFYIKTTKDGETISRIMQYIKSQFARRYNQMTGRIGPFWNERFTDTMVEFSENPINQFFKTLLDILYTPVIKNKVADPRMYPHGSINAYLDEKYIGPVKITLHSYFISLGKTFNDCVIKFLEIEERYRKGIVTEGTFA